MAAQQKQQQPFAVFQNAVTRVFQDWTALRLAVQLSWAGPHSEKVANEFLLQTLDLFKTGKKVQFERLADWLDSEMASRFHVDAEDDSPDEVADLLLQLYETCRAGDFSVAEKVLSEPRLKELPVVAAPGGEEGDDDDDCSSSGTSTADAEMEAAGGALS